VIPGRKKAAAAGPGRRTMLLLFILEQKKFERLSRIGRQMRRRPMHL
jgi:hypothetical protein